MTEAGWYADPEGHGRGRRYWDGSSWTEHYENPAPVQARPAPVPQPVQQPAAQLPPAGWKDDPAGGGGLRYWDGAQWTDHYHPAQEPATAQQPASGGAFQPTGGAFQPAAQAFQPATGAPPAQQPVLDADGRDPPARAASTRPSWTSAATTVARRSPSRQRDSGPLRQPMSPRPPGCPVPTDPMPCLGRLPDGGRRPTATAVARRSARRTGSAPPVASSRGRSATA